MSKILRLTGYALCLVLLFSGLTGIHAWFADRDAAVNPVTIGVNTIRPEEEFEEPVPGEETVKAPAAVNTGTVDCYVRGRIVLSDSRAEEYLTMLGLSENWQESEDGWLIYREILKPGEKTDPVFQLIRLEQDIPDALSGVRLDVIFESVQSYGFDDPVSAFAAVQSTP